MSRPSQVALIVLVYLLGALVALRSHRLDALSLASGLLALVPVAVSVHYVNEYADYETDAMTERTPFSGGSGALQSTDVTRGFALRAAWPTLAVGLGFGVVCLVHGLPAASVLLLGTIALLGWQYSLGPLALVWRGAGEVTNAVLGGLLLPLYGAATQTGGVETTVALAMVPFTLLVMVNLLATHWPDREADAAVGKRTLVTMVRPRRLRQAYVVFGLAALVSLLVLSGRVLPPSVTLLSLPAFAVAAWGYRRYTRQRSPFPAVAAMVTLALGQTLGWGLVVFA